MIKLNQVAFSYQEGKHQKQILGPLELQIQPGEKIAVVGASGCGKSTLLMILAGILKPTSGQIEGQNRAQMISYMPQNYGLLPWKNVYQNVVLPYRIRSQKPTKEEESALDQLLEMLEISHLKKRYPMRLSGGQRQRVALARAFALKPDLLLMDEPFSALDAYMKEEAMSCFMKVWEKEHAMAVMVTHSIEEALYMGDTIWLMSPNPGRIHQILKNPLVGQSKEKLSKEALVQYQEMEAAIKVVLQGGKRA